MELVLLQSSGSDGLSEDLDGRDSMDVFSSESFGVFCNQRSGRVGQRENLGSKRNSLESSILSDVSATADEDTSSLEGLFEV